MQRRQALLANRMTEMKEEVSQMAALANLAMFDKEGTAKYVLGSPHLKYACVRELYESLVVRLFNTAKQHAGIPRVLDLGAGEGSATLPFLELGAHVTAVDISESQLASLAEKCGRFSKRLQVRHEAISETFKRKQERYDVVVMNSFLHHIPDYLGTIQDALSLLQSANRPDNSSHSRIHFATTLWDEEHVCSAKPRTFLGEFFKVTTHGVLKLASGVLEEFILLGARRMTPNTTSLEMG